MEYTVQLSVSGGWRDDKDVVCTCGNIRKIPFNVKAGVCPECGNTLVITTSEYRGMVNHHDNALEIVEKNDQGFHIKREEVKVSMNMVDKIIHITRGDVGELSFNMKDKRIRLTRNGKNLSPTEACINTFFKGVPKTRVLHYISTPRNRQLFDFCYQSLGKMGMERNHMWGRGLTRLIKYPLVEVFGLSPMSNKLIALWVNFRPIMFSQNVSAPHKLLGVHRFMIEYIGKINGFNKDTRANLSSLCGFLDNNTMKMLMETFDDESSIDKVSSVAEQLIELHKDFGYSDVKRTVLYITREVKLEQGIISPDEAVTLLRDYARMSQAMGIKHDNYPKSLKKDHDIALANYTTRASEFKQKEFARVLETSDYVDLDLKGEPFSIVRPSEVKDIIDEGRSLSHCVASYVDDIIKKKCKILFLRSSTDLDESLVTVEVRGTVVRQVRGRFNRSASEDEKAFISAWAKKKDLTVKSY